MSDEGKTWWRIGGLADGKIAYVFARTFWEALEAGGMYLKAEPATEQDAVTWWQNQVKSKEEEHHEDA